jgi:hypothetical protein
LHAFNDDAHPFNGKGRPSVQDGVKLMGLVRGFATE